MYIQLKYLQQTHYEHNLNPNSKSTKPLPPLCSQPKPKLQIK